MHDSGLVSLANRYLHIYRPKQLVFMRCENVERVIAQRDVAHRIARAL